MNNITPSPSHRLLIVDDTPYHLQALTIHLHIAHFEVQMACNGEEALKQAEKYQPDLILLDVLMPKMDGFETCRQLKSKAETNSIPVIFMTALDDEVNKVKGFEAGGVDYVTKPIHHAEVLIRINTHLKLRQLQQSLEIQNLELQKQNEKLAKIAHVITVHFKNSLVAQTDTVNKLAQILSDKYLAHSLQLEPLAISQFIATISAEMLTMMSQLMTLVNPE